ncbi:MAG: hypothetical protein ACE5Z5_06655 [Candidatus Bathyarchaeia archaeon]
MAYMIVARVRNLFNFSTKDATDKQITEFIDYTDAGQSGSYSVEKSETLVMKYNESLLMETQ